VIKEEEMKKIEDIIDLIKTIVSILSNTQNSQPRLSLNALLIESDKNQGKIVLNQKNMKDNKVFSASVCLFQQFKFSYAGGGQNDNFEKCERLRVMKEAQKEPLRSLAYIYEDKSRQRHFKFQEARLITGIADFVQVYMRYSTYPIDRTITLHLQLLNVTKFLLENMTLEL